MTPMVLAGSSNVPLATAIAARLGTRPIARGLDRYPDAELPVVLRESVRDQDIFIVEPTGPPADQQLMELLFLADAVRPAVSESTVVVAPDTGAVRIAEHYQRMLGCPMVVVRKSRLDRQGASLQGIVGDDVSGRTPIVVDDMIATGATVEAAVNGLLAAGCRPGVTVVATHALFVDSAIKRLHSLPLKQIVVTNTVDRRSPLLFPARVVDVAGLLADTIARLHRSALPGRSLLRA